MRTLRTDTRPPALAEWRFEDAPPSMSSPHLDLGPEPWEELNADEVLHDGPNDPPLEAERNP